MDPTVDVESTTVCHVVAMPFPGRGHINPMMNLCKLLASKRPDILITLVVTEEWLGFIGSDSKPDNIQFASIPNVIPPERLKAADFPSFYEAVMTKMEAPFDRLLDLLEPPVTTILADIEVLWGTKIGNRRNIPVTLLWTMSATFFSLLRFLNLFAENKDYLLPLQDLTEKGGEEQVQNIPGVQKAQYLLFTSVYELEPQAIDNLQAQFPFPLYTIGPAIPYLELDNNDSVSATDYLQWLNSQPQASVLYISLGSFLSASSAQMDEIAAGLRSSGVRFLWVARGEASRLKESCGDMGLVVPWCEQLKVLCHSSVGGFWTHCGWNSTLEAVFAGVPMLTFPLFLDQFPNSSQIVEDWKIGWRVEKNDVGNGKLMKKEVAELVGMFMNLESDEGKEMRKRARELVEVFRRATGSGGSSETNINAFIKDITQGHGLH
ncbi:hypothetical protein FNV43_RR04513 [Rhamnella rubrinervis]|uniref:UDP-glycosyltransferase 87A1 n=1 Tax=Rhamnella rubrinervis TaxID=2594499 RepID=A0A8K0HJN7_9ROSA|nr:hypothetical protein FNV43_RR04513 [Rhamnella rubrinervis]